MAEQLYAQLEQKVRTLRPADDLSQLEKAYRLAAEAHKDQTRQSGEPYIVHPLNVALILADMQMDLVCIETGLLHDTVEDTKLSLDQIRKEFGDEVARCVDGVTKLSKLHHVLARGAPGRKRPQNAARDGERYSRGHREAGRPAA